MSDTVPTPALYDGEVDRLMTSTQADRIVMLPEAMDMRQADTSPRIRIMWGQYMLQDLLSGRYRSLVCAVNPLDNSRGIITELATMLPTSQWDPGSITNRAKQFSTGDQVKVLKFDMDAVEVLALLRPPSHEHLTMDDLRLGFKIVSEMIHAKPERMPSASVSFLGARSNALRDEHGCEPSFETVLRTMHESGYTGDVYPAPGMWELAPTAVYARYPFPPSVESMREGGF